MAYLHCKHIAEEDIQNIEKAKYLHTPNNQPSMVVCHSCGESARANKDLVKEIKGWLWGYPMVEATEPSFSDTRPNSLTTKEMPFNDVQQN